MPELAWSEASFPGARDGERDRKGLLGSTQATFRSHLSHLHPHTLERTGVKKTSFSLLGQASFAIVPLIGRHPLSTHAPSVALAVPKHIARSPLGETSPGKGLDGCRSVRHKLPWSPCLSWAGILE